MKELYFPFAAIVLLCMITSQISLSAASETVFVKYRGPVNLAPFVCESTPQSSLVNRLCYDLKEEYVIVKLYGTYYHYCEVPTQIVQ